MWLFLIQFFFLKTQPFWLYSLPLFSLLCMLANCSANPLDQSKSPIHFSRSKLVLSYPTIRALPKKSPKEDNNSQSTKASHSQRHNPFLTNNSHHFPPIFMTQDSWYLWNPQARYPLCLWHEEQTINNTKSYSFKVKARNFIVGIIKSIRRDIRKALDRRQTIFKGILYKSDVA